MTSSADNAELVRRYFDECVGRIGGPGRESALSVIDELLTDTFVMTYNNDPEGGGVRRRERHKAFLIAHEANYPEDRWTIEAMVASESTVACQWRLRCRHAKTGNPVDVRAADFFSVSEGRLDSLRRFLDFEGFREQTRPRTGSFQEQGR
jgi:ketosteroid isomerase-like protein